MISPTKTAVTRFTRRSALVRFACAACTSALCLGLFAPPAAQAQAPIQTKTPAPHLSVSVGLENNHLVLGQPIVLRYAIRADNSYFSLPFEQPAPWMRVTLRDASGKTVASCGVESVRGAGSLRLIGWDKISRREGPKRRFNFAYGGAFVDRVFFGEQRLPIPDAGSYTLTVETTALWSDVPGTLKRGPLEPHGTRGSVLTMAELTELRAERDKPLPPNTLPSWAEEVSQPAQWDTLFPIAGRFVFRLQVERNPERLTQIAEDLRKKMKTQPGYESLNDPLRGLLKPFGAYQIPPDPLLELFSLYGAPAEAVQNALAAEYAARPLSARENLSDLLNAVLRMGTPETMGWVLGYKAQHGPAPGDTATVYYQADRNVQKMLLEQLNSHGQRLPRGLIVD